MKTNVPLEAKYLRTNCEGNLFKFTTTTELTTCEENIGQRQVIDALEFGLEISQRNYHLCVVGSSGLGKTTFINKFLQKTAQKRSTPSDWCYVHNFENPLKPTALQLPAGLATTLRQDMLDLIEHLFFSIPQILESEQYRKRVENVEKQYKKLEERSLKSLQEEASGKEMSILDTPNGFTIAPTQNGKIMTSEELDKLPEKEKRRRGEDVSNMAEKLLQELAKIVQQHKDKYQIEKKIEKEFCTSIIITLIDELKKKYENLLNVSNYLKSVEQDIIDNPKDFLTEQNQKNHSRLGTKEKASLTRYQVNVFVSNNEAQGAPIILETNPTYSNLTGKLEYEAQYGYLNCDFTLIKPGALHRANGGFLILNLLPILKNPYAWDSLKRILLSGQITIEAMGQMMGLASASTLEPEAIPLNIKIILIGDRYIYNLLSSGDDEFKKLFKVIINFEDDTIITADTIQKFAQLIAKLVHEEKLFPFHRSAVASVIEQCVRLTGDSKRISLNMQSLVEILKEANFRALQLGKKIVKDVHVLQAIEVKIKRVDCLRRRLYEEYKNGSIYLDVSGDAVGQINAIAIIQSPDFVFGHPARITAKTWLGDGSVIDIQKEARMGGPIHSKSILILAGFLKGRYAKDRLISLSVSLVFEQTYCMIEGDSASLAELCALLSSLANISINQAFAVTGSINQHGDVQPVGCINEKIEGFFDICQQRGLNGEQGVIIPKANIKNLMLRQDVVEAVSHKKFHIYPVNNIDEAMFLLTGIPAGMRGKNGKYPPASINYHCEAMLQKLANLQRKERKASLSTKTSIPKIF